MGFSEVVTFMQSLCEVRNVQTQRCVPRSPSKEGLPAPVAGELSPDSLQHLNFQGLPQLKDLFSQGHVLPAGSPHPMMIKLGARGLEQDFPARVLGPAESSALLSKADSKNTPHNILCTESVLEWASWRTQYDREGAMRTSKEEHFLKEKTVNPVALKVLPIG